MTAYAPRPHAPGITISRALMLVALASACAWPGAPLRAQAMVPSTFVQAVPGASSVTLNGTLKGPNLGARDYVVRLEGGRTLKAQLDTKSPDTWFAVLDPYGGKIYANEGDQRTAWSGRLPDAGEYRVRVYLGDEATRQARGASYTLRIGVEATQ